MRPLPGSLPDALPFDPAYEQPIGRIFDREVELARATGDPVGDMLAELRDLLRQARQPISDRDAERLARAAAQGASVMARDLVRAEIRRDTLWTGAMLIVVLLAGIAIGFGFRGFFTW